jgi:CRISPR-associated protein (TIGR02584 family)
MAHQPDPAPLFAPSPAPAPSNPADPTDTILLAVTGMSPAILTETIWALAHEPEPVIPSRVIALTTTQGRLELERRLFAPLPAMDNRAPWDALRDALATRLPRARPGLRFGATPDDIRVITALDPATGRSVELPDLRTPSDNEAAADFLLEQVRSAVENPDTRLIVSIAGGRKTMGALLYACMTLIGRESDRLTHVLVNEPFDALRDFWFPAQPGAPLPARDGRSIRPADARIELADVPFVPLRNLFTRELGRKPGTFSRLVATCREGVRQRAAEHLRVAIDTARSELDVNGTRVKLAPSEQLVLLFLARRTKQGEPPFAAYKDAIDSLNDLRRDLRDSIPPDNFSDWRHADALRAPWEERELTKAISSLRDKLRRAGPDATALSPCLPEKGRCSLDMPPSLIHIK